jgi:hypothetical protein
MLQLRRPLPLMALLVGVLALTLAVAACGGADQATATTRAGASSDLTQAALAFVRCMRQHGINMPDPKPDGRIDLRIGDDRDGPRVRAAQQACRKSLPGGQARKPTAQDQQQALAQGLAFARCMRQHGINLPDPEITAKGNRQYLHWRLPTDVDRDDPRLGAAEQACHQYGSLPNY